MDYYKSLQTFRNLMEASGDSDKPYFDPKNVYRTYFAIYLGQTHEGEEIDDMLDNISGELRSYYLDRYLDVVRNQLMKYYRRGRISKDFEKKLIESDRFKILHQLMDKTFRSDMKRKNERWLQLTGHLRDLQDNRFENPIDMLLKMDRINNTVHNTGEVMLTKFENYRELLRAFEKSSARDTEPKEFKSLAQDIRLNKLAQSLGEESEFI